MRFFAFLLILAPCGTPNINTNRGYSVSEGTFLGDLRFFVIFHRFSSIFYISRSSGRCVFRPFFQPRRACLRLVLVGLRRCDIADYIVKTNRKSTFSRFLSFCVFQREIECWHILAARGLWKIVFFWPQRPELSALEFSPIFNAFRLHFELRNGKKRGSRGGAKKRWFLTPNFHDFYRFWGSPGDPKIAKNREKHWWGSTF